MSRSLVPATISTSCSIFVGNVPYDAQEDELKELFGKVGNVTSVRIVCDKDTKTPKGYAFADFADPASVQAAVDKLNHVEYNGRKLRIDAAERELHNPFSSREDGPSKGKGGGKGAPPVPIDPASLPKVETAADRLARQKEAEAAEKAKRAQAEQAERAEIARLMETLTPQQVLHVLGEMQRLTIRAPDVARALIAENSQLALALHHAEFLAGLLEEPPLATEPEVRERARSVREKIWGAASAAPASTMMMAPGVGGAPGVPGMAGAPGMAPAPVSALAQVMQIPGLPPGVTPLYMPGQFMQAGQMGMPMGTAPAPGMPFGYAQAVPGVAPGASTEEQRRGILEQLAQLSPAEIDRLPHDTKVQLLDYLQKLPPRAT